MVCGKDKGHDGNEVWYVRHNSGYPKKPRDKY